MVKDSKWLEEVLDELEALKFHYTESIDKSDFQIAISNLEHILNQLKDIE